MVKLDITVLSLDSHINKDNLINLAKPWVSPDSKTHSLDSRAVSLVNKVNFLGSKADSLDSKVLMRPTLPTRAPWLLSARSTTTAWPSWVR